MREGPGTPSWQEGPSPVLTGSKARFPKGIRVGNAHDEAAGTGCTAVICDKGGACGVAVQGGAPATRETCLLRPENMVQTVHAVVLSGGSAFGLDACSGVMRYLEEREVGFLLAGSFVPIVTGASLFDLSFGNAAVRPNAQMGYRACEQAAASVVTGNVGAGCGATVGKLLGAEHAMKGGLGAASIDLGGLIISAVVAVNAVGSVRDRRTGVFLAGTLDPTRSTPTVMDPYAAMALLPLATGGQPTENTTIGCIVTNASLSKAQATRVALMAHDAYARVIEPVHTSNDGDAVFALCTGEVAAGQDAVGIYAAVAMEMAIYDAVTSARGSHSVLSAHDLLLDD
ncbi:MAG: P1 family peptidase [Coriobacteriales bacterium]|nr:P1 family peptidase [Coriobacteriales bacterium]